MQIKRISIKNLSSLINFENDADFLKTNLIFGTNGSGKSTLVGLLQHIDSFIYKRDPKSEENLKTFIQSRISKEASSQVMTASVTLSSSSMLSFTFDPRNGSLVVSGSSWMPVKVFDDKYTARTIGDTINVDFRETGIIIGEVNRELDEARRQLESLSKQLEEKLREADAVVYKTIRSFRDQTESTINVDSIISRDTLLAATCTLPHDSTLLTQRKQLGYSKPDRSISELDFDQVRFRFSAKSIADKCTEVVLPPEISVEAAKYLKNYTEFYRQGVSIYNEGLSAECPFCRREWPESEEVINRYRDFLQSTYSEKRKGIKDAITELDNYRNQITGQIGIVEAAHTKALAEATKYGVDLSGWKILTYNESVHDELIALLDEKYNHMERSISIYDQLVALENLHIANIENNNRLIMQIISKIDSISQLRMTLNRKLANHFAWEMWSDNQRLRAAIIKTRQLIEENLAEIERLENESPPHDVIRKVFNDLLNIIGLGEYTIDANKRLNIVVDKNYDISNEGSRISSAQKKILSLCYFFAEIVSEIDNPRDLKNYVLVFDDPVDSADYVYFHSIATIIEKAEKILSVILQHEVKFGQFFVFTHNSLLYDRLSTKWKSLSRTIRKENGVTVLEPALKTINNYAEYISAICRYYKNPNSRKNQKIFIGNVIRRVLEILSSFESLGSNDFQSFLDGMGKPKLALLANHLSHESFSRVLNPLSEVDELRNACKEVLEIIREHHPTQFATIKETYQIDINEVNDDAVTLVT